MTYLCLALLLVLAGIFYLVNRNTGVQASDDPLSVGMVERWNAALPAGFPKSLRSILQTAEVTALRS